MSTCTKIFPLLLITLPLIFTTPHAQRQIDGDDDLGVHQLGWGDEFSWSFRVNFWGSTLYSCTLKWENLTKSFDVFSVDRDVGRCMLQWQCYWKATEAGIYFSNDNQSWVKEYGWQ
ncbi:Plant self-incompatibility S1 [Dillenia turbinata]|uniref:S-protein homolog n=1 Tax=Dillenia turbinata TaxID=194707 RepID=A0AAN8UQZ0_9MAGN